ncbi:hypothetical protein SAMN02744124_03513 [Paenibacillus barengoltzii J12]|uniref:Uncharacterized protein n=1 Tax=Paenibacillus barengoltzii J12 TaxID=935846 RepID=A0ABY1M189_9BACL|nr:hypothetical protein SAMN02744124_03513 [Paenibacillus barengoltzii J12]
MGKPLCMGIVCNFRVYVRGVKNCMIFLNNICLENYKIKEWGIPSADYLLSDLPHFLEVSNFPHTYYELENILIRVFLTV